MMVAVGGERVVDRAEEGQRIVDAVERRRRLRHVTEGDLAAEQPLGLDHQGSGLMSWLMD